MHVGIANPRWRGKHSRRMRNPQFYISGKKTMARAVLCKRIFLKTLVQIRLTFKHSRVHYPCVSSVASIKLRLDSTKGLSVDEHCPLELRDMDLASLVCLHGDDRAIITTLAKKTPTFQRPVVIYRTCVYTCNYKRNGHYGDVIKGAIAS